MRKTALGLLLALSFLAPTAALGQACPPVAALPDSERRVAYAPSASTGPFSVTFAILGDSTDYGAWAEVWLNGVMLTPVTDWQLTIPAGTLSTACRPITNASITLTTAATGTLQIVGARRPRRTSQFPENAGVSARSLNQVITDITATNRETWDKINDVTGRGFFALPGQTGGIVSGPLSGIISGPASVGDGNLAVWNGTSGAALKDGGPVPVISVATPVTKAILQTAISAACSAGGGIVQIPPGTWAIDTSAGPLVISGTCSVIIQGAGADANTGTTLQASSVANNMFSVTNVGYTAFRDFGISTSVTKNSGTSGIAIDESTSGHPNSFKVIERMRINGHFNSIQIDDGHQFMISDNLMTNFTGNCVAVTQPAAAPDLGVGVITGNKCWDVAGTAGADSAILWQGGSGLRVHNNRILCACNYGIKLVLDQTVQDSGALIITDNLIEVFGLYGVYLNRTAAAQAAGRKSGQLVISGNHFQSLPVGFRNAIAIETSAPSPWVEGAVISNNIFQNLVAALLNSAVIRIDDGNGISVTGNLIYNTSPGDGGIRVAGGATNAVVDGNRIIGGTAATRYVVNSTTTLRDQAGTTTATLPSPGDGSLLWDTTTATMKLRQASGWHTIGLLSVTQTWTAAQTFTSAVNVLDNLFRIQDNGDQTKQIAFEASSITTGTTRTWTAQDANGSVALNANNLSFFSSTTSAQLAGVISDETGTGVLVFGTAPIFTTSIQSPLVIGGTGTTGTQLTLKSTTGNGTTDAIAFVGGNNGATSFATMLAAASTFGPAGHSSVGATYEMRLGTSSGNQALIFATGGTLTGYFSVAVAGTAFFTGGAQPLQFGVNNAGQILINSAATNINHSITTASTSATTGGATFGGGVGVAGALWAGTYLNTTTNTVGALPACGAGIKGARTFVSDNNTALAFAAVITAGGAIQTPVYCDGTVWRQGANDNDPLWKNRKVA